MISVGPNSASEASVVGKTIAEVVDLMPNLRIPPKRQIVVDGIVQNEEYKIEAGADIWVMPTAGKQN